ncbi:MAG: primary-amine oxidase [Paludisphaera borealis]|uniref:primary-amine oxidase n=1 Tax=Paludisphaera borealis TaxID=1387353 RepID=UPI00284B8E9A|nr:primary-amine oxidase [Paludisphaera borealis]MDR3617908.1 primary-amine oxidase [Paludisphaera borealis]
MAANLPLLQSFTRLVGPPAAAILLSIPTPLVAQAIPAPDATAARPSRPATPKDFARHPLDPLGPAEIERTVATLRNALRLSDSVRFVSIGLKEPPKEAVRQSPPAGTREAFVVLLDSATGRASEAIVDLDKGTVASHKTLAEGVQPAIMIDELVEVEETARKSSLFREAMKKRGIEDLSLVMVDGWSAGHYGNEPPEDRGKRLVRALCWVRSEPFDNGYARPIENLAVVIDLNRKEVVRIEDYGDTPLPLKPGNWSHRYNKQNRADVKALEIEQPDGPSFALQGQEVAWQKWDLRIGFNPREGLILHQVRYDGRPVLYRASIAEMIVPYADPKASSYHKNVFDLGEYGLGMLANSLALGCDCLGTIRYLDAHMADSHGRLVTIKNAVCIHEEDAGLLWKHTDWRTGESDVRRSRRLAVSMVATVGNYDYGFYWYFYQDGSIQHEVKLTGIVNTTALKPGETARHGVEIAPRLTAPYHQHFFNVRLDFAVDGEANSLEEVNTRSEPAGPDNPYGGGFFAETTPLLKELEARRSTNAASARFWRIVNPTRKNSLGRPVAYRLCPGETTLPFAQPASPLIRRAGFLTSNLWATPFQADERFPAGEYPNQNPTPEGLPKWTQANRDIADRDLVLWYTFGQTHVPRLEDWPVMPVASVGFMLRPDGFFEGNPALDLPPPSP